MNYYCYNMNFFFWGEGAWGQVDVEKSQRWGGGGNGREGLKFWLLLHAYTYISSQSTNMRVLKSAEIITKRLNPEHAHSYVSYIHISFSPLVCSPQFCFMYYNSEVPNKWSPSIVVIMSPLQQITRFEISEKVACSIHAAIISYFFIYFFFSNF